MIYFKLCLIAMIINMACSRPTSSCGGKAADVVFVVDTSSSIWQPDFNGHVLPFVRDVINLFDIGPARTQTRVGMVTFGDDVHHQFHLNEFQTTEDIAAAIDNTLFRGGNTFTNKALDYVTREMFTAENGARADVVHIIVILTDGGSDLPRLTMKAVDVAKQKGIQIFAVGVGHRVDYRELREMSSEPTDQFMFHVKNFKALDSVKSRLAIQTCKVTAMPITTTKATTTQETTTPSTTPTTTTTDQPTTLQSTTSSSTETSTKLTTAPLAHGIVESTTAPEELPQGDQPRPDLKTPDCEKIPADVYFVLDVSSSLWVSHFNNKVLPFVRDLVKTFDIGPSKTRVGVVTFADKITPVFGLDMYTSSDEMLKGINPENIRYTGERKTNTASALSFVRQKGFAPHIARMDVPHIVIVITDGRSNNQTRTAKEAEAMKASGMYVFAVGVGPSVDPQEMKTIGSEPEERFVFHVNTFDALSGVTDMLVAETCNLKASRFERKCNIADTDLFFVFESASKSASSRVILRSVITDFAEDLKEKTNNVRVGSLTDPCPAEDELSFLSLDSFKKKVNTIVEKKESKMHRLMKKLREDKFAPKKIQNDGDRRKVGVIFLDDKTVAPSMVVREALKLKKEDVELYVVAVGDVSEYLVAGIASGDSHTIRLNSYSKLKSRKLDYLWNVCAQ